jgi:hypothetical protein
MDTNTNGAPYQEGAVYQAEITDQLLTRSRKGEPQLVLTVKIQARLKNEKHAGDGVDPCPEHDREVRITFVQDDYERLQMAIRDLERLDFADDDISRLHPDHPECHKLLNMNVHVRMKVVNDNTEYWNLAWPREKARPVAIGELQAEATSLKDKIAEAKAQMKRDRGAKKATTAPKGPTPPEVGY